MNTRKLVTLITVLFGAVVFANNGWAGDGYDDGYDYSHQQLLDSSYRLIEQAEDFRRYARKYSYSRDVRRAGRAMQNAADDLYYQLKHGGSEYQVRYAYQHARKTYYTLRDCYYGYSHALNELGYVVHDVERDYQRYQRQLASYNHRGGYGQGYSKGYSKHYRGQRSRPGFSYHSGSYRSGASLQLRIR